MSPEQEARLTKLEEQVEALKNEVRALKDHDHPGLQRQINVLRDYIYKVEGMAGRLAGGR